MKTTSDPRQDPTLTELRDSIRAVLALFQLMETFSESHMTSGVSMGLCETAIAVHQRLEAAMQQASRRYPELMLVVCGDRHNGAF